MRRPRGEDDDRRHLADDPPVLTRRFRIESPTDGSIPSHGGGTERPTEISNGRTHFDEVAAAVIDFASRGRFLLIVMAGLTAWIAGGLLLSFSSKWLEAGVAGIAWVTLLLVFAVENAHRRSDQAVQRKLNAIAEALAAFMDSTNVPDEYSEELRAAVGLEVRESTHDGR